MSTRESVLLRGWTVRINQIEVKERRLDTLFPQYLSMLLDVEQLHFRGKAIL